MKQKAKTVRKSAKPTKKDGTKTKTVRAKKRKVTATRTSQARNFHHSFKDQNKKRTRSRLKHALATILGVALFVFIGGIAFMGWRIFFVSAVSDTVTITSQTEWESGEYWPNQLDTTTSPGDLTIADGGVGSWSSETPGWPTDTRGYFSAGYEGANYGSDLTTDGTYVYMVLGGNQPGMYRYNPEVNTWKQMADAPSSFYQGSAIEYYNGYIYAVISQNTNAYDENPYFFRYSVAADSWEKLNDAPGTWGLGSDIVNGQNGKIYAAQGKSLDTFWSYDVNTGNWSDTLPTIPSPYQIYTTNAHALIFADESYGSDPVKCEQGCVFAFRGNNNRQFFRYDIAQNLWYDSFSDVPAALGGVHYGSSLAFDSVNGDIYALRGVNGDDEFMKYDIDTETWDANTADTPDAPYPDIYYGAALTYLDGYVYGIIGENRPGFFRFNIGNNEWDSISTPVTQGGNGEDGHLVYVPNGSDCSDSEGCLFTVRGNNGAEFYRYDLSAESWAQLTNVTGSPRRGSSMCYDGDNTIYMAEGDITTNVYAYSISGGSWSSVGPAPGTIYYGGSITCMGDGEFYLLRGNNQNSFYHYDGGWTTEDNLPVTAYFGGALSNDGTYVYALAGNYRGHFYRFEQGAGWTAMTDLPSATYYSSSLEYDGSGALYLIPGILNEDYWKYDITGNSWSRMPNLPGRANYGTALAHDNTNDIMYALQGWSLYNVWKYNSESNDYPDSASWISRTIDLTYVTSFNSFSAVTTTPGSSSITYETRTSNDQVEWSDWQTITGGTTIQSPTNRYIQVKVSLNSDGTNAPTLSSFTINFEKDSVNPTNPSAAGYSDSSKAVGISTDNSYYHVNPYFEFTSAADGESGLEGYYVSWTSNASHDPTTSEDYFQTAATYEVNTNLTASSTYYLRLAAKDQAENTASVITAFTYTYNGVTPAATTTWTEQEDFEQAGATATNLNTAANSGGSVSLASVSDGVWTNEAPTPDPTNHGGLMVYDDDDTLYILRGTNTTTFWSYSLSNKTYTTLTGAPAAIFYGASAVFIPNGSQCADADGCIFVTRGGNQTTFYRYNISADNWSTLAATPTAVHYGGSLTWNGGNFLYGLRGGNQYDFWRYSISADSWTSLPAIELQAYYGASLVHVPNGDYCDDGSGCLFASRGSNDSDFLRFDISANRWVFLQNIPIWQQYGTSSLYIDGYVYLMRGYGNDFYRYDISNNTWGRLAEAPIWKYQGSRPGIIYVEKNDTIYMLQGDSGYGLYAYDVSEDRWRTPGIPTALNRTGFYYGATAWDSDDEKLYFMRGQNNVDFYAYDPASETVAPKTNAPFSAYFGSDMEYINGEIYYAPGLENRNDSVGYFYKYNPDTDVWTRLGDMEAEPGYGLDLVWDGDDTIYTARAQNTTTFYKYSILGNSWSTVASNVPGSVYQGACAVRAQDPNDSKWYIYQTRGNNLTTMYRYDIAGATWNDEGGSPWQANAPGALRYGSTCVLDNQGNILIPRGNATTDMYIYNIVSDTWSTRSVTQYYEYGSLSMTNDNIVLGFRGESTATMERYVVATATTGFESNGTWTSQILDFGSNPHGYGGITVNMTEADGTSITVQTRTCSDSGCADDENDVNWEEWTDVSNAKEIGGTDYYSIDSTVAQYGQARLNFVSDQLYSPTVEDITWSSYSDATAPTNPSTLTAQSENGGDNLTSGEWYNHTGPYFAWSGHSDNSGGIGIEGFYVYFGTNSDADPATDGTLQSSASYAASGLNTGTTYYLRIKTRDYNGNVSATAWAPFVYSYDNVAPSRPTNVTANPAVPSGTNNFDFTWTAASDSGGSPSYEYCYKRYFDESTQDSDDTCVSSSTTSLSDLEALSEGTNYFYIRTKDEAGNYSNSGEYESVAFRWAQTPPTLPQLVTHGATEDAYQHTFAWNAPASSAFDINSYCFQINEEPTSSFCNNSTYGRWTTSNETNTRFLAAFNTPNTQPGTNYFYIVAKDEAGLVNYDAEYDCDTGLGCVPFISNTISPNAPQNFNVSDASDRDAQTYRLTLGWKEPADNPGSQLYSYRVYRSTDNETFELRETLLHNDGQSEYAYTDVSLSNQATYYYYVTATDSAGAESMPTLTKSFQPEGKYTEPPDLVGNPSVQPRIRSALIEWLTEPSTHKSTSFVQYGLTTAYGGEQGNSDLVASHSVTLIDLEPATQYNFRLKWVDQDGNTGFSPNYTFTTKEAPSPPINLSVDPEYNTVNSFTFDWEPPADEGVNIDGYFYSVNNIPTADNASFVSDSTIGPIDAASQQGINTIYIVAVDDGGNFSYANYASVDFEVETAPPGKPQNVTIIDSSDRNAERYNITLTWDPPTSASAEEEEELYYTIYRSENDGETFADIARITSTGYLDTELNNEIEYYYKVTTSDKANAVSESTDSVSEIPEGRYTEAPDITQTPVATPDSYSALISWETGREASSFVEFGLTEELGEEQGVSEQIEDHAVTITGLLPETTYYYRIKSIDIDENAARSDIGSFTTLEAPRVSDVSITDVRLFDAIIAWTTNKETTTAIEFGTTTQYGQSLTDVGGSLTFTHTLRLENLTDGTTYNVRMTGTDANGNPVQSDNYSFTTLTFPRVDGVQFQNKAEGETEVTWTTNVPTTSTVEYFSETQAPKTQGNTALVTEHSILLFGLEDAHAYSARILGTDQFGYEALADNLTFTTLEDTTPPIISNVQSESNSVGTGDAAKVQIIVSWQTNEPTSSQVEYGEGLGSTSYTGETDINGELVFEHLMVVSDLAQARTYHFRVVSIDKAGNESASGSYSVLTSRKRESFLQLVIANLEDTFSWLGNLGGIFQ
ncbi:MAG: hypothetical protein Q8Q20_04740 [bacterium]|nr:hypothetical protein [bacterium]